MSVGIAKILRDLGHEDVQIKSFALMSVARLMPGDVQDRDAITELLSRLEELLDSDDPDVVFLARKALNHVRKNFSASRMGEGAGGGAARAEADSSPSRRPEADDREGVIRRLSAMTVEGADPREAASLLMKLKEWGTEADMPLVMRWLESADDRVRANAVEVLGTIGDSSIQPVIERFCSDADNRVRANAVLALYRLGRKDVRGYLDRMMKDERLSVRASCVYVLANIPESYVVPYLLKAADDEYDAVRSRAAKAMARFPCKATVEKLKLMMRDDSVEVCEAALAALRYIKGLIEKRRRGAASSQTAEAGGEVPAAASSPAGESSAQQKPREGGEDLYVTVGTAAYRMCRDEVLSHERLDAIFYEILRYQDFLRAYKKRLAEVGGDEEYEDERAEYAAAVGRLEEKLRAAFSRLGRVTHTMWKRGELPLAAEYCGELEELFRRIGKEA